MKYVISNIFGQCHLFRSVFHHIDVDNMFHIFVIYTCGLAQLEVPFNLELAFNIALLTLLTLFRSFALVI